MDGFLDLQAATQADVDSLYCLTEVTNAFYLWGNSPLTNLDGLANLTAVGGYFEIAYTPALTNVDGLTRLSSIGGEILIFENSALTNLDGLAGLSSAAAYISLTDNHALTSVDGLANLTAFRGPLQIVNNSALCQGDVDAVTDTLVNNGYTGTFSIADNNVTCDWDGDGAPYASDPDDGDASVWLAPDSYVGDLSSNFTTFCAGYAARRLEGSLYLATATQADVDSLACLTEVSGYLNISYSALTDLNGLANLSSVGEVLYIYNNSALTDLDGLAHLSSIDGGLWLENNDALTDITGLSGLSSLGGSLYIYYNNALCQGDVDAMVNALVGAGFSGVVTTGNNDSGC